MNGQRDVLAHRALHQQRLGAVGRRRRRAPARMASAGWRNDDRRRRRRASSPPLGRSEPGEDVEQLVLALALERDDAQHLARVELERDVVRASCPALRPRAREPRASASAARARRPRPLGAASGSSSTISPSISSTIRSSEPAVDVDDADGLALAQDRRAVADGGDLDHPVRDEDDASGRRRAGGRRPRAPARSGSAGSAAVISSSISTSGSIASARARSMIRSVARGRSRARLDRSRSREAELVEPVAERLDRASRSAAGSTGCRGRG